MNKWELLETINAIITPIGFLISIVGLIITIISLVKIRSVEKSLKVQKEQIIFKQEYILFCQGIKNQITIIEKDGINENQIIAISNLLDKINRFLGVLEKDDAKELKEHIKSIDDSFNNDYNSQKIHIVKELNKINNIIEKAGKINGI